MENSGKMLFGDNAPIWYIALGQKYVGPMSASEIYEKIVSHQITPAHYAWRKGQSEWKRICDIKVFQTLVPHQPEKSVQKQLRTEVSGQKSAHRSSVASTSIGSGPGIPARSNQQAKIWYLYQNNTQYGPFSPEELKLALRSGRISVQVHGWRDGMKTWERLLKIPEFHEFAQAAPSHEPSAPAQKEKRGNPRRPLVAKIMMANQESVIVGLCRDISIGGLQVLAETVPGEVGAQLRMNISPSTNDEGDPIEPFVAEGKIVRILEDGRGFSFRFTKLGDRAKQAIESFIDSPV